MCCGQDAQSYEVLYGLYDLDSVGWQLHVAEFHGSAVLVWYLFTLQSLSV